MASTVLVKDALWRVCVILQDTTPQFQRWPERELVHWLNDGQTAITKFLPAACSRVDVIKLKPGTRQSIEVIAATDCIPGDGSTPTGPIYGTQLLEVIRNMGQDGQTPGKAIRMIEREIMDSQSPSWHQVAATAVSSYMYDPRMPRYWYATPGVHPTTPVWVEIAYTAQPVAIPNLALLGSEAYRVDGSSSQTITIADEFLDDLVNYVVARAHMKDAKYGDPTKAVTYTNMFTGSLNAKVTALTGNNPNLQRLPLAPEPIGAAS